LTKLVNIDLQPAEQIDTMSHAHDCTVPRVRSPADASLFLQRAGLRPTRQRQALALSLFGSGEGRHVTAEELHVEARAAGHRVSLATIYNTLHSFASAGLVREIAIGGAKRYFDTNTSNHNHFHVARDGMLMDIDAAAVRVDGLPTPPPGMRIAHVDVVVHLEPAE
jgi:Fur family iron response transcriptional regulator